MKRQPKKMLEWGSGEWDDMTFFHIFFIYINAKTLENYSSFINYWYL